MGFVQVLLSPTLAHLCSSMAETRAAPRLRGRRGRRRVTFRAGLMRATPLISVLARASIDGARARALASALIFLHRGRCHWPHARPNSGWNCL